MKSQSESLLIVSAGIMQIPAIITAKSLGLHVIATDKNPNAAGFEYCDEPVVIDSKDIAGHLEYVRHASTRFNIVGSFAGSDVAVTVAAIANELGLPSVTNEVAIRCHNKGLMKKRWIEDKIPTPYGEEINHPSEARRLVDKIGLPVIVKPVDNAASRGSIKVDSIALLDTAVENAFAVSRSKTVIIEQYVIGYEQSVETIIYNGVHHHVGMADREFGFHPYHIETAHIDPSILPSSQQDEIYNVVDAAARSLGITFGPAKADMIWTENGPMILEMTGRLSGGFHSQYTTPLSTGQDPIRAVIEMCVGRGFNPDHIKPKSNMTALCSGIFPEPGRIMSISGLDEAEAISGVKKIIINRKIGDILGHYVDNGERCCWVITAGKDLASARASFVEAKSHIKIVTSSL
jgi:biotin carboxylase